MPICPGDFSVIIAGKRCLFDGGKGALVAKRIRCARKTSIFQSNADL